MVDWWNSLNFVGQIFACIALPSTLILIIQTILSIIGISGGSGDMDSEMDFDVDMDGDGIPDGIYGDFDTDIDGDFEADIDSGFRLFSFRTIIAFFAIFGWTGLVMMKNDIRTSITLIVSIVAGFIAMVVIALLFYLLTKLQQSGNVNIKNALGVSGTVYLKVPPARQGKGKVNVIIQGVLTEVEAVTDEEEAIPFQKEIVVIGISGQNTLVIKSK